MRSSVTSSGSIELMAQALDRSFIEGTAKQIEEFDLRREVATVGAEVDATENDLAESEIGEAVDFQRGRFCGGRLRDLPRTNGITQKEQPGVAAVLNLLAWGECDSLTRLEPGRTRTSVSWKISPVRIGAGWDTRFFVNGSSGRSKLRPYNLITGNGGKWSGGAWGFGVCGNCRRQRLTAWRAADFFGCAFGRNNRLRGCALQIGRREILRMASRGA